MEPYDEDLDRYNGGPAFFGILVGAVEIAVGLVRLAIWAWRNR